VGSGFYGDLFQTSAKSALRHRGQIYRAAQPRADLTLCWPASHPDQRGPRETGQIVNTSSATRARGFQQTSFQSGRATIYAAVERSPRAVFKFMPKAPDELFEKSVRA